MLFGILAASAAVAAPAPMAVVLPHAEYVKACLASGGMAGHYPTGGSADVYQISTARFVELSVLAEPGANTAVLWRHATADQNITTTLTGSTTMAFGARSVKLMPSTNLPVSWCARVR